MINSSAASYKARSICVVGGGPAGMMAAGRAAEAGAKVTLVEKTYRVGSKLLITGGSRCNITNSAGANEFIAAFGKNGRFLYRALAVFSNRDLIEFFRKRGLAMRVDPDGKVFPSDDRAESVLAVLRGYLEENRVRILHNTAVTAILCGGGSGAKTISGIKTADGGAIAAGKVIIATGGMSYPKTGSTGDGYALAAQCGHSIVPPVPGLIPLESDEPFIKDLQGLTLKAVAISVMVDGKIKATLQGDILFTHFGVSSPAVLILSNTAVDALASGSTVDISLNLAPSYSAQTHQRFLQTEFESCGPKTVPQYLAARLPRSFAPVFERLCALTGNRRCSMASREERKRISSLFTDFRIHITKPRPIEEATITRGGVALDEIDPRTMESRIAAGLYFCGEVLDVAGITGGYNLQETFSTGSLAGGSAAQAVI